MNIVLSSKLKPHEDSLTQDFALTETAEALVLSTYHTGKWHTSIRETNMIQLTQLIINLYARYPQLKTNVDLALTGSETLGRKPTPEETRKALEMMK